MALVLTLVLVVAVEVIVSVVLGELVMEEEGVLAVVVGTVKKTLECFTMLVSVGVEVA